MHEYMILHFIQKGNKIMELVTKLQREHAPICVYRGKRPHSHRYLEYHDIKTRIDLQSGIYERFHNDVLEAETKAQDTKGINVYDLALSDFLPPTTQQVRTFFAILRDTRGDVYFHCLHGKDRTGYFAACLRFMEGSTYKAAVGEMFSKGFHKLPYIWWLISLYFHYRWLKKLSKVNLHQL